MRPLQELEGGENDEGESYLAGAAEGGNREKEEEADHSSGQGDYPVGHVAGPGTKNGVEPGYGEYGEQSADGLVEKLFESAPEAGEAALCRLVLCSAYGRGHKDSLAQKVAAGNRPVDGVVWGACSGPLR